ncbi:hypothetical protein QJS10_CPB19g01094 [Acorus calamus]|uniref:PsbP C-terminal domain-containing protein n=1 Tax=Acorus calamus TaxID=4465 RepID=A0AAV9CGM9_ACOCL|nr:hypothetical protein QJS10_CPB19g01094 [Acorus calamus]
MAGLLLFSPSRPPKPYQNLRNPTPSIVCRSSRRELALWTASAVSLTLTLGLSFGALAASEEPPLPPPPPPTSTASNKLLFGGISNTRSWFLYDGDGFSIRVPPQFDDVTEPEDYNVGLTLYGDKAKPKTFAARFASADGSEVLSVVIRPSNQLKITFLEAQDITDLGSLKEAARIFVPNGATLHSARTLKIKEDEVLKTYYFYEFSVDNQHIALVAAVNSGKAYIAGATAPQLKWEEDGVKLRSAAISLSVA